MVALGFVAPVMTMSAPSPASADTVIDGCTIVSNPTAANFTNCPGVDLTGSDLSGVDLSYADLAGTRFADCNFLVGVATTQTSMAPTSRTEPHERRVLRFYERASTGHGHNIWSGDS